MKPKFDEGDIVRRISDKAVVGAISKTGTVFWDDTKYSGYVYLFINMEEYIYGYFENQLEIVLQ